MQSFTDSPKRKAVDAFTPDEINSLPPLSEGVLQTNLGVKILVIVNKADKLNQQKDYHQEHFDFIGQYLRRVCLRYGAGLIYSSATTNENTTALHQYLLSILYQKDFTGIDRDSGPVKPSVGKDTFVPIGWDSLSKIQLQFSNQNLTTNPDEPFEQVYKA